MKKTKLPCDLNQRAKAIVDIFTEIIKIKPDKKNKAAVKFGAEGGKIRANNLSKEQRSEIAKKAALARWKKH